MRVLHVCMAAFYIDNYGYQENILPKMHQLQGLDVAILASTETYITNSTLGYLKPSEYKTKEGIPICRLPYVKWLPLKVAAKLRIYNGINSYLERFMPDIIFLHDVQSFANIQIVNYIKRNPNVKIFADGHADFTNSAKGWISKHILHRIIYRKLCKLLIPYVEIFYGTLPCRVDFFINEYCVPKEMVKLLVMGVDDSQISKYDFEICRKEIREKFDIDNNKLIIITGGKINALKNIHFLIEAISEIKSDKVCLLVFGEFDSVMEEYCNPYIDGHKVKKIGWLNSDEIYPYLIGADLGFFPGKHSVIWEQAVGVGLPCVFKRIDGHDHIDLDGNCILLDTVTVDSIQKVIIDILENPVKLQEMKIVSELKGKTEFSYFQIAKKSIEINN